MSRLWSGILVFVLLCMFASPLLSAEVALACKVDSPRIDFAVGRLEQALKTAGSTLRRHAAHRPPERLDLVILSSSAEQAAFRGLAKPLEEDASIALEGYRIVRNQYHGASILCILSRDETGAMYGVLDLAEQVRIRGSLAGMEEKLSNPRFPLRAVKFNLPWMSYRKHESLQLHMETCRDLNFWREFLDMMAENRFNALTLWNLHPFTFMIRPKNFPEACPFSDQELADWQDFWRKLLRLAKERGIETYILNWNIFVSPEFAKAHNVSKYSVDWSIGGEGDTSELVKRYTRECVTQVIDEYEDLTGLGVTLGERMGGMTPQEREDWLVDTFGAGMKAAKRPVKFIHRAPLSANKGSGGSTDASTPLITRDGINRMGLTEPVWVEMKFNWSHGHSTPRLSIIHGGKASESYWEPKPANYKITWMIRNEDFFILRWGEPDFIRQHISQNSQDYVGGYFVGSECYIPAQNYIDKPDAKAFWPHAFNRQWLFYVLWGRLLYDPSTPDSVFENAFDERYGKGLGKNLLAAYAAASRMPLKLASFYKSSWDFSLYSEGFLVPSRGKEPFISIDNLIKTTTLDPDYVSISDYVQASLEKKTFAKPQITPLALADSLTKDGAEALRRVASLPGQPAALVFESADVKAWAHLSLYFADKLRGGVALETFRRTGDEKEQGKAIALLESAARHWDDVIAVTRQVYPEVPVIHLGSTKFSWEKFRSQVQRDIEIARNKK